jgi:hypothetical protein
MLLMARRLTRRAFLAGMAAAGVAVNWAFPARARPKPPPPPPPPPVSSDVYHDSYAYGMADDIYHDSYAYGALPPPNIYHDSYAVV